jgi:hypothetical protein
MSGCSREEEFQFSSCVFEGASPSATRVLQDIADDARLWCLAGASGLRAIWP